MTKLLGKAFSEVSKLPEGEQDAMAGWLLEELASERRWKKSFSASQRMLASMANEAVAEHRQGRTKELDVNKLCPHGLRSPSAKHSPAYLRTSNGKPERHTGSSGTIPVI